MSTSKLIIKHEDGEEVEIVVGREYIIDGNFGKWPLIKFYHENGKLRLYFKSLVGYPYELTTPSMLHNLPAKSTHPMNQAERLAVLRGGCEVKCRDGRWHGCPSYWIVDGRLTICGEAYEYFTNYRCAPDWDVEREFTVEVDG